MEIIHISLAAARVNAKMTQDEVAKKMGVSNKTVLNWEKGIVKPSLASLNLLAQIYKIPIDYLEV